MSAALFLPPVLNSANYALQVSSEGHGAAAQFREIPLQQQVLLQRLRMDREKKVFLL